MSRYSARSAAQGLSRPNTHRSAGGGIQFACQTPPAFCRPCEDPTRLSLPARRSRYDDPITVAMIVGSWLLACGIAVAEDALEQSFESGPVKATVRLDPAKPLIGDPVTLTISVTAEKDVELLMPEFGEALERFSIVDFVPRESIDDQGRMIAVQAYRLQPPTSGLQSIPPILIEYVDRREGRRESPEGLDAYELLTDRMEFEVQSVIPADAEADLKPPLGRLERRVPPSPSRWPWVLGAAIVLGVAAPLAGRALLAWRRRARRQSAYQIARARLDRLLARPRPAPEQIDAFYVELSDIVRRYLEDRFELRAPELTTEEFLAAVGESPELSREHQALLREFLRQADLVKFAGLRPSDEDIQRSVAAARRFLEETREDAPLIDDPTHGNSAMQRVESGSHGVS